MFDTFPTQFVTRRNTVLYHYWDGEIQCTGLLGQRNTVLQYYLLFTIQIPKNPEIYFRYYKILFKIALNSLFNDRGVVPSYDPKRKHLF